MTQYSLSHAVVVYMCFGAGYLRSVSTKFSRFLLGKILQQHQRSKQGGIDVCQNLTHPKTNMAMENTPCEDVCPIESGDVQRHVTFSGL